MNNELKLELLGALMLLKGYLKKDIEENGVINDNFKLKRAQDFEKKIELLSDKIYQLMLKNEVA